MMKMRRLWRRSRRRRQETTTRTSPFATTPFRSTREEQEELVRSFERAHAQQSLVWRGVFTAFLLGYVVFLLYSIVQQMSNPWGLRYHAYFMEEMGAGLVIFADVVAVVACLLAVKGLRHTIGSYRQWLWYSCYTSLFIAIFWLYHMARLTKFRWDIIWLPLGPLSGAGICLYVDHLFVESSEEIRKLRQCMYNYKVK